MSLDLLQSHTLIRVPIENLPNEICHLGTEIERKLNIYLQNLVISLILIYFALKRSLPCCQLVAKNSQTPQISSLIIKVSSYDLRRNIIKSATEGLTLAE